MYSFVVFMGLIMGFLAESQDWRDNKLSQLSRDSADQTQK
jgi:hypothetical protein